MNITKFEANNFKCLTAIAIEPSGAVVTLAGSNGAGKSSILDAIMCAISGGKTIPERPIRDGAEDGEVVVTLSNGLKVTRRFTKGGSTLRVESADGIKRSPQGIMDALTGNLTFDPLEFTRMKEDKQVETLRVLAKLDFSSLEKEYEKVYSERTETNRKLNDANSVVQNLGKLDDSAPAAEVPAAEVLAKIDDAEATNKKVSEAQSAVKAAEEALKSAEGAVVEAEKQIEEWKKILFARQEGVASRTAEVLNCKAEADKFSIVPVGPLRDQLTKLESENARVRKNKQIEEASAKSMALGAESRRLSSRLEEIETSKATQLRDAKFPLPELTFKDGKVFYREIPFSQISSGEKLRISVAVGMALNPELKIIFVRDGALLDPEGLKTLTELATTNRYQVWIEDNRSTDPTAVVIEDGAIKK